MRSLFVTHNPLPGLGMASVVLGLIALLLAFLPILGIPISAFGLLFGLCGLIAIFSSRSTSLRWSLAGLAVSALALSVNVALLYAPLGYQPGTLAVPEPWQPVPDRPAVPPPARGEGWLGEKLRTPFFERLLAIRNDVGLLSEEYDPKARRQVGSFPQAFSHIGLVNTARNFSEAQGPAEHRRKS